MSWDEYDGRTLRSKIWQRMPLIATAFVILALMVVFVGMLSRYGSREQAQSAVTPGSSASATTGKSGQKAAAPSTTTTTKPATKPEDALHPKADDTEKNAAISGATNFVKAWANPRLPQAQWLAGIKPFTSADTIQNFQSVDPQNVPANSVIAPATIEAIGSLSASVLVPTDAGPMRVVLDNEWKAEYIEPVGQPGSNDDR